MRVRTALAALGVAVATLSGCTQDTQEEQKATAIEPAEPASPATAAEPPASPELTPLERGAAFLAENGERTEVTTTSSGLQYEVLASGTGEQPGPADHVTTHYHGTLLDGSVFDSSVQRGEPAGFRVNRVIQGWQEALQLMRVGDKWKLYVPSELAYGSSGMRGIGPDETLIFEVELLGVQRS